MTDYGHELKFGTFITPAPPAPRGGAAGPARRPLGYDLITFQDHPYQPALLDAQALLAYVAAQTEHAHLSANVTNLPLRQPVVIARSRRHPRPAQRRPLRAGPRCRRVLGCDRGRRRTPAQPRSGGRRPRGGDPDHPADLGGREPGGVRVDGEYYRVVGGKRGPAPPHDIGISIGAYKPRMLVSPAGSPTAGCRPWGRLASPHDLGGAERADRRGRGLGRARRRRPSGAG